MVVVFLSNPSDIFCKDQTNHDADILELSEGDKEMSTDMENALWEKYFKDYFSYSIKTLLWQNTIYPSDSSQNPENAFLRLSRYSTELHVRPDVYLTFPHLTGMFKPRLTSYYKRWEDGMLENKTDNQTEVFTNEWKAQADIASSFFVSYGKERLLWGPSFLTSPSNPFYIGNERQNPKIELEGKYFFKMSYLPTDNLTFTLINQFRESGDENLDEEDFRRIHGLKTDIVGENYFISLLASRRKEDHRIRFGSYGQWTVSDPLLIYYDGRISRGIDTLFPDIKTNHILNGELVKKYKDSNKIFSTIVLGGSFTTLTSDTVSVEFLYNNAGYNNGQFDDYHQIRKRAADTLLNDSTLSGFAAKTLVETQNTGNQFLRRYYLMCQYQRMEIKDILDITLRYTQGLQDGSGLFISIAEVGITDSLQFFSINNIGVGGGENEFKSIFKTNIMFGLEYSF
jgi:hypothetical protein